VSEKIKTEVRVLITVALTALLYASPASAQKAAHNSFHYGPATVTDHNALGASAVHTQKTAYCNSNGQDVGALFIDVYPSGTGEFSIVGGGSGRWEDKDWTQRSYETGQQAKVAGEKYAAKVFNRACSPASK
jgi:hypothetical protein